MLEMGEPVSIFHLAKRMIELSGARVDVDIPIKIVGIRPGEKLQEDLREPEEQVLQTEHPFIARLIPIMAPPSWFDSHIGQLAEATAEGDGNRVRHLLFAIAGVDLEGVPSGPRNGETAIDVQRDWQPAGVRPEAGGGK
jgi:FlaA1/EpsC-like NDP-sugar epimerase